MKRIIFTSFLVLAGLQVLMAQDQVPLRGRAQERVEQWKKIRLMEALRLDEETSIRFFARYNKHMEMMRTIGRDRSDIIDGLQELTRDKGKEADIDAALTSLGATEERVASERARFLQEVKTVLTIRQVGAYVVFERNFNQNLREIMQEIAKERSDRRLPK